MTRSIYGPSWSRDANARRLTITRALTATLMTKQTVQNWTWVVLVDPRDELLDERLKVFRDASPNLVPIYWDPDAEVTNAPWDKKPIGNERAKIAATAYKHPGWLEATMPRAEHTLMTRLDDDDGFAVDALERFQRSLNGIRTPTALMLPEGFRVWDGRQERVRHETNAMHSLFVPPGVTLTVYDYGHRKVADKFPVRMIDNDPGWLWYRHPDTLSGWKQAIRPITPRVKALFPVDWSVIR